MYKYEFRLKTEQIQKLKNKGDYLSACKIAETIDWNKVKSISILCEVADIYDKTGKYNECKEVLLLAYDRSPIGRMIVYRLAEVNIKLKEFDEAKEYYEDFLELAPKDPHKYVLKYKLEKAKGAKNEELIAILEDLKATEFTEQWAYELAYLYHRTGLVTKCVEECDDIFLWFGEGKYVDKALELKMLYEPLSPLQKEHYDKSRRNRMSKREVLKPLETKDDKSGELNVDEVSVSFNTVNLQKELAKSMQQIMSATQKETVTATMNSIDKMVKESNIPDLVIPDEPLREEESYSEPVTEETIEENASMEIDFKNFLNEDYDGQISLSIPNNPVVEKQITGQMSIEDVLAEWEKTKQAAKEAMEREEKLRLEEARAHALKRTEDILERLAVIPVHAEETEETLVEEEPVVEMAEEINGISYEEDNIEEAVGEESFEEKNIEEEPATQEEISDDTIDIDQKELEAAINIADEFFEKTEPSTVSFEFNEEQKEIFTYFLNIRGVKEQIKKLADNTLGQESTSTSETGNIIITGYTGQGKTKLATAIIKSLQKCNYKKNAKIGKIAGSALNSKSIASLVNKLGGGYLIIENAGELSMPKAIELSGVMDGITNGVTVILEGDDSSINKLLSTVPQLAIKFTERVDIPKFTNDELIIFGKNYAKEEGYTIDEMGVLALYNRIGSLQFEERGTTLDEVIEIIDEAIENSLRVTFKKAFGKMFSKKQSVNGLQVLVEKDFE